MKTSAKLIGVINPLGDSLGFVTPIFETPEGRKCFQDYDETCRIEEFIDATILDENIIRVDRGFYSVGDEAVFGFYISKNEIWLKRKDILGERLQTYLILKEAAFNEKPFLLIEIGRFIKNSVIIKKAIKMAFFETKTADQNMTFEKFLQIIGVTLEDYNQLDARKDVCRTRVPINSEKYYYISRIREEYSVRHYEKAARIARSIGDKKSEEIYLGSIGRVLSDRNEYPKSIDYYEKALMIARHIGNKAGEGVWISSLGNVYYAIGEYPEAITYYKLAFEIAQDIGDKQGEEVCLAGLGNAYHSFREYREAIMYYEQALEIARDIGDKQGEGNRLGSLGNVYHSLGEYRKAIMYYEQALEIARDIGDKQGEGSWLRVLEKVLTSKLWSAREKSFNFFVEAILRRKVDKRLIEFKNVGFDWIKLWDVLKVAVSMIQNKIKLKDIEVKEYIPEELPPIKGNLMQLSEAFFNLIDNAYDAIKERQSVLKEDGYKGCISVTVSQYQGFLKIMVEDNGMGIKENDRRKLFMPFFTTKAKGLGLGLCVIEKIIMDHNGKIEVDSIYYVGSRVTIYFPLAEKRT